MRALYLHAKIWLKSELFAGKGEGLFFPHSLLNKPRHWVLKMM